MARKDDDIISTRLRMPAGLHRLLTATAKRNNRSINSEILWCLAKELGGDAGKYVEHMKAEQRTMILNVMRSMIADPKEGQKFIDELDKKMNWDDV